MNQLDLGIIDVFNQITVAHVLFFMVVWLVGAIIVAEWTKRK